jgi:hypothetical protein
MTLQTTPIARQHIPNMCQWTGWKLVFSAWSMLIAVHATVDTATEEWCCLGGPCLDVIIRILVEWVELSSVQFSAVEWSEVVGELVIELLRFSPYEPLLLEAGSWGTGIVREHRVRGMSVVGIGYYATTSEDAADWEDLVHAVVNCSVCELVIVL